MSSFIVTTCPTQSKTLQKEHSLNKKTHRFFKQKYFQNVTTFPALPTLDKEDKQPV